MRKTLIAIGVGWMLLSVLVAVAAAVGAAIWTVLLVIWLVHKLRQRPQTSPAPSLTVDPCYCPAPDPATVHRPTTAPVPATGRWTPPPATGRSTPPAGLRPAVPRGVYTKPARPARAPRAPHPYAPYDGPRPQPTADPNLN